MKKFIVKISVCFVLISVLDLSVICAKSKKSNKKEKVSAPVEKEVTVTPEEKEFIGKVTEMSIQVVSEPKQIVKGVNFKTPYIVLVSDSQGTPLSGVTIDVDYPDSKENSLISRKVEEVVTDEEGKAQFLPAENPSAACLEKIYFYPKPVSENPEVINAVLLKKVSADWKVKSDIINKGAVLFIWEFNEKDKPFRNAYNVLSELKALGVWNVGNAPVNETSDIGRSLQDLYKANYEIIEASYGYLVCGTVKFTKPVEAAEDGSGYICSLAAEISAIEMKTGNVVYTGSFADEVTGTNWNNAVSKCKEEIAEEISKGLVYGL